jgi:3-hydroxyacyl-CoA dehydrogenase / enoyl-CoA hydratase / 3-hydroxybutyryl-CoA epimerase
MSGFDFEIDADGVATVTMDMPDQAVNTMNAAYGGYMASTIDKIRAGLGTGAVKGVIFTSAKKTFFAGGDIATIQRYQRDQTWDECFDTLMQVKQQLMELESLGVPMAAAINGAAMGGGFEICLSCHYRVALDAPGVQIGFPEVSLGLLPAAGGIVRTVRLLGLRKAVPVLMEGTRLAATQAKEAGLIDEIAATSDELLARARAWVLTHAGFQQPWLRKDYQIPGGNAFTPANAALLAMAPAVLRKKSRGLLPAPEAILAVAAESTVAGYQASMVIESRYFDDLIRGPVSAALIGTMYKQLNEIGAKASRPPKIAPLAIKKVGILGAGMMGRGIAYVAAQAGIGVVLKDVNLESAQAGKSYTEKLLNKQIERGRSTPEQRDAVLALIQSSMQNADLADCDIVIEAVFEDIDLKRKLTRELLPYLKPDCIFASNTSTLPISLLAEAHPRPEQFIGLHFFSPVDKMNLVEIIRGRRTDERTLAHAYDFVQQIRKTPIVVADGRGFYTSRVFGVFCDEGVRLLEEGVNPVLIENLAKQCGMPVGPLAVMDEVEITLMAKVAATNKRLDELLDDDFSTVHARMNARATAMVAEGRTGRAAGKGFYDYAPDGSKVIPLLWKQTFGERADIPLDDIEDRLMFRQSIETLRCLERGVLKSARDANVGAIFGWGFPAHTGGTLQLIEGYGRKAFAARAAELTAKYGERFNMPANFDELLTRAA